MGRRTERMFARQIHKIPKSYARVTSCFRLKIVDELDDFR